MPRKFDRRLVERLGLEHPIIQAPMAGVSTPALAAAVCNAGGLGSIAIGAAGAKAASEAIAATSAATNRAFNVNLFCHRPAKADPALEAAWLTRLAPEFSRFGAEPPAAIGEIYTSFLGDEDRLALLLQQRPKVVSFHFGLPSTETIAALKEAGIFLIATATSLAEGRVIVAAGIDAVVAQGFEAGGHRGVFDENGPDAKLGTLALTRLLAERLDIPVIAAGGIMDGAGIAAALRLGAAAAQLGTAFIACPESAANADFRAALLSEAAERTIVTRALSGRPARSLPTRLTELLQDAAPHDIPAYPIAYDAAKAIAAAAAKAGQSGYAAQWAGQGAPLARQMPAADLMAALAREMRAG
ncbi:NAD(P)H-dependent flavin oxidoreductase [Afifella pfennigii]|uniref:NAD(P)H-dependent flavin oxidoreductase n=1 Tax=Afifella pfennigii TaxID=209897 RepID=UPI00047A4540|nr:nitronate monooxygenase [Afifella pfennigii]